MPPFNTAIVNGYNKLTGAKVELGRWDDYLAMRRGILDLNARYRDLLSNDLGAVAGLLFDIGSGLLPVPVGDTPDAVARWEADLAAVRAEASKATSKPAASDADRTHTEIQAWLRDLGCALGFQVWVAANDRNRAWDGGLLADGCLPALPPSLDASETVRLPAVQPGALRAAATYHMIWHVAAGPLM